MNRERGVKMKKERKKYNDLVDVYTDDVDVKYGINKYTVNIDSFDNVEFDSVKFMLWDDFQTMTPLVNGCVVE